MRQELWKLGAALGQREDVVLATFFLVRLEAHCTIPGALFSSASVRIRMHLFSFVTRYSGSCFTSGSVDGAAASASLSTFAKPRGYNRSCTLVLKGPISVESGR